MYLENADEHSQVIGVLVLYNLFLLDYFDLKQVG